MKKFNFLLLNYFPEGDDAGAGGTDSVGEVGDNTPEPTGDTSDGFAGLDFNTLIPEKYKDEPWAGNLKSVDDMFDQFANAQSLLGKKAPALPSIDDPFEKVTEVLKPLAPEDPGKYELSAPKLEGDLAQFQSYADSQYADEAFMSEVKSVLHKHHVHKSIAPSLVAELDALLVKKNADALAAEAARQTQITADFDSHMEKAFGDKHEHVVESVKQVFSKYAPADLSTIADQVPGFALAYLVQFAHNMKTDLLNEDKSAMTNSAAMSTKETYESVLKKAQELQASVEFRDQMHPDHEKTVALVRDIHQNQLPKLRTP